MFGLHGLAINHKAGNYTDPMLIGLNQGVRDTIHEVFTNVCLNQSVLWYAKQSGQEMAAPGFNKAITAVVPIKDWNHPAVWKLFVHDSDIGAMQTSAHLRNTITPLPKPSRQLAARPRQRFSTRIQEERQKLELIFLGWSLIFSAWSKW